MGIQIKGSNDTISAADGSMVLEGAALTFTNENITGISTMASAEVTSGDLTVGVSTFFVDNSTGKIGIGTVVPAGLLEIDAASTTDMIMFDVSGVNFAKLGHNSSGGVALLDVRSEGHMRFLTNGNNERLRITSTGTIGINTSVTSTANAGFDDLVIRSSAGGNTGLTLLSSTTSQGTLAFADGGSSSEPYRGYLQYSHNGDKLVLGVGGDDRVTVGQTGDVNITGITTAKSFVPTEGQLGNRNLVINGAMLVAQRGTSSTSSAYATIDRFQTGSGNIGQNVTQSQQSLSSTDTGPYGAGFRKFKRAQLAAAGNANANAYVEGAMYAAEAQDIANSGWDFTSSSSFITLSFWFRCSTNQAFMLNLRSEDGTARMYSTTFTASGNNTWTKITKTIPGNTSPTVAIDDNNGAGLKIFWGAFYGTDYTDSGSTMDAWKTYSGSSQGTDMASTWLTAGASTFDVTGVQLEVGSAATPFEHRSYDDEYTRCKRYFQDWSERQFFANKTSDGTYDGHIVLGTFELNMRVNPTVSPNVVYGRIAGGSGWIDGDNNEAAAVHNDPSGTFPGRFFLLTGTWNWHSGYNDTIAVRFQDVKFDAEL